MDLEVNFKRKGENMKEYENIEKDLTKIYRKNIWSKFVKGICDFQMIKEGDKIAVCISGGKDSMLMAKCFQEIKRHRKMNFDLEFIVMNPGYNEENKDKIIKNAEILNIPIKMFETRIFESVERIEENPCYICARMRRGYLYEEAKRLGCNKIALGHHFDDVIETILLSMFYGAEIKTMLPKLHSENFEGMELIRPLYYVKEHDIISWKNSNHLEFLNCACRFTEHTEKVDPSLSKRLEMKALIHEFRKKSDYVDINIFRSIENVNLDAVIAYRKGGEKHSFLDNYDE